MVNKDKIRYISDSGGTIRAWQLESDSDAWQQWKDSCESSEVCVLGCGRTARQVGRLHVQQS